MSHETPLKPKQKSKLIKVIGHKPVIKFNLNGKHFKGLRDTGWKHDQLGKFRLY